MYSGTSKQHNNYYAYIIFQKKTFRHNNQASRFRKTLDASLDSNSTCQISEHVLSGLNCPRRTLQSIYSRFETRILSAHFWSSPLESVTRDSSQDLSIVFIIKLKDSSWVVFWDLEDCSMHMIPTLAPLWVDMCTALSMNIKYLWRSNHVNQRCYNVRIQNGRTAPPKFVRKHNE